MTGVMSPKLLHVPPCHRSLVRLSSECAVIARDDGRLAGLNGALSSLASAPMTICTVIQLGAGLKNSTWADWIVEPGGISKPVKRRPVVPGGFWPSPNQMV